MQHEPTDKENVGHPNSNSTIFSRRTALQLAAAGAAVGAIGLAAGAWSTASAQESNWTMADIPPQNGRNVLVTGGNGYREEGRSGLGYEAALALARVGADVVIASRDQIRGDEAVSRIKAEIPGAAIQFQRLDLADLNSVRDFAGRTISSGRRLDVLINNAGVMGRFAREVSVDGYERVFATNTVGHFALTALLLPLLRQAQEPRLVWVSSLRMSNELRFNDLQLQTSYDYAFAYDQSKLANLMLAQEFARRSQASEWGIASMASHPGVARTNLIPSGPGMNSAEGWRLRMLPFMFQPAADGVLSTLFAASSPLAATGAFYGPNGFGGTRGNPGLVDIPTAARDERSAAALFTMLEQLTQVRLS